MSGFWAQRKPRERVMLLLGLVVVIVGGWMGLAPGAGGGSSPLTAAQARAKADDIARQTRSLEADMKRVEPMLSSMVFEKSADAVVPETITLLQKLAKDSAVHLREVKPQRPRRLAGITRVPISVRYSTDFARTVPFLYKIEDPAGRLVVQRMNVTRSDPKSRLVDVEIEVVLYTRGSALGPEAL